MKKAAGAAAGGPRRRITLERTYQAAIEDVWDLWTTKQGIESWWGPDGFEVKVRSIDLRPGGELRYAMTAVGPLQVQFMTKAGVPLTTEARITYTEILAHRRLAYLTWRTSSREYSPTTLRRRWTCSRAGLAYG